jgi:hypothetical protein
MQLWGFDTKFTEPLHPREQEARAMTDTTAEAAAAVVTSRRALTAAERRADAEQAERVKRDLQLAAEAHRLAVGRLRAALMEERSRAPLPGDVTEWLKEHLASKGGTDELRAIRTAGHKVGHSEAALRTAVQQLELVAEKRGRPTRIWWSLPG